MRHIARPSILSEYYKYSNMIDKHNHVRQSELAIEKNVGTHDGYMRLFCTYLGITITDAWKCYRDRLGPRHHYKELSIHVFSNIVCKFLLLNDYNKKSYESAPQPTLRLLTHPNNPASRSLSFPEEVEVASPTNMSTLGSGTGNLINLGNGRFIPASFEANHQHALCEPVDSYVHCKGSFGERRRVRGRCKRCGKQANSQCNICHQWHCNPLNNKNRFCFEEHKAACIVSERLKYYEEKNE